MMQDLTRSSTLTMTVGTIKARAILEFACGGDCRRWRMGQRFALAREACLFALAWEACNEPRNTDPMNLCNKLNPYLILCKGWLWYYAWNEFYRSSDYHDNTVSRILDSGIRFISHSKLLWIIHFCCLAATAGAFSSGYSDYPEYARKRLINITRREKNLEWTRPKFMLHCI
jgi:hypothetical protein